MAPTFPPTRSRSRGAKESASMESFHGFINAPGLLIEDAGWNKRIVNIRGYVGVRRPPMSIGARGPPEVTI